MDSSSDEEWIVLDAKNPADSSDDDRGVLALPYSPDSSDLDLDLDLDVSDRDTTDDDRGVLALPYSPDSSDLDLDVDLDVSDHDTTDDEIGSRGGDDDDASMAQDSDGSDPFEVDEDEPALPLTRPLSAMFHHTPRDAVAYAPFDPLRLATAAKRLIPDPAFAALPEAVSLLASSRGLVCLRGATSGLYYVANPATFRRVRLPPHACDHRLDADPAVVIAFDHESSSRVGDFLHYHVVVAFQVTGGVWGVETFSSRTWAWTVGGDICAPETVIASSGVGALGRAFWRTTIGHILCVTPETGRVDLIPAPHEVAARPEWEIGEMEGSLCVACADEQFKELAVLYMVPGPGELQWAWAGQFDAEMAGCHAGMTLLRSQGAAEVVVWDSVTELVIALDFDGRQTRSIGPLAGRNYCTDFIPYIGADTEIYSEEVGAVFKTVDAVTFRVPQPSIKEEH